MVIHIPRCSQAASNSSRNRSKACAGALVGIEKANSFMLTYCGQSSSAGSVGSSSTVPAPVSTRNGTSSECSDELYRKPFSARIAWVSGDSAPDGAR